MLTYSKTTSNDANSKIPNDVQGLLEMLMKFEKAELPAMAEPDVMEYLKPYAHGPATPPTDGILQQIFRKNVDGRQRARSISPSPGSSDQPSPN